MPAAPPHLHLVPPPPDPADGSVPARHLHLVLTPDAASHVGPTRVAPTPRLRLVSAVTAPRLRLVSPVAAPRLRLVGARLRSESGQASVEFVAALPLVVAIVALAYQALLAGQAVWEVRVASRAAARANAFGGDAEQAARAHLRAGLERGLRVRAASGGDVEVSVRVPRVIPVVDLGRAASTSHFRPQS